MTRIFLRACGRSDDGQSAVLRQDTPEGSCFLWPDPDQQFSGRVTGLLTLAPGATFRVRRAGSLVFFRSAAAELCLYFDLLPELLLSDQVTVEIDLLPSEVDEGTEFQRPPPPAPQPVPKPEVRPQ